MELRYPDYYKKFSCIAAACPDSCCHEWEVDVDPVAAQLYRTMPGDLGDQLRRVLREGEDGWASMINTPDRRCPMWRQDGLCQIHAQLGHEALCETCRDFPRLRHEFGDFAELGLELSCPEAARIMLSSADPKWVTETIPGGEEGDYDPAWLEVLTVSRQRARDMVMDENLPLGVALSHLILYAAQVQCAESPEDLADFDPETQIESLPLQAFPGSMEDVWQVYRGLEVLTDRWQQILDRGSLEAPWLPVHRALARYFIDRYWLQAVSDGEVMLRAKFMAVSCLVVRHMGGDPVAAAQLYSKEIENDPDNVDTLFDAMEMENAFADLRLLNLLRN